MPIQPPKAIQANELDFGSQETLVDEPQDLTIHDPNMEIMLKHMYIPNKLLENIIYSKNLSSEIQYRFGQGYMIAEMLKASTAIMPYMNKAMDCITKKQSDKFNIISFDVETTGINTETDYIVSIAFVIYCPTLGDQYLTYHTLIDPQVKGLTTMPSGAYKVHGISMEDLYEKPTIGDISGFIHWAINQRFIIGYNSHKFDLPILIKELKRFNCETGIPTPAVHVDLYKLMRRNFRDERATLSNALTVAQREILRFPNIIWDDSCAHDALYDSMKTMEIFTLFSSHSRYHWRQPASNDVLGSWQLAHWSEGKTESFKSNCIFLEHSGNKPQCLSKAYLKAIASAGGL
jgi:DNA polymerase III epsilon subunit-like protein